MNELNKVYKAIFEALGGKIREDYSLAVVNNGKEYDIKVDKHLVYLPVSEALNVVSSERAFFHPACESIVSKETEMDKVLRKLISNSIYFNFRPIADVLFKVAAKKSNKMLSNSFVEQLAPLRDASKEVILEVVDLVKRISMMTEYEGVDTRIVALTMIRGGKTDNGEQIYYRCVPTFPFYTELKRVLNQNSKQAETPDGQIIFCDQKYSYQAALCVALTFELAIPCVMDTTRAEAYSTIQTAARMCAMLRSYAHIANEINTLVGKFRKEFDGIGVYGIDLSWVERLDELPDLVGLIPSMKYNNYDTASKAQEPEQNLRYDDDLFGVQGINSSHFQAPKEPEDESVDGVPPRPPAKPGEIYRGMTTLSNGLFEFRYQSGNFIRVVCVNEKGKQMTENYINANLQPVNQYVQTDPNGWQYGNGYAVQPNGVIIPRLLPNHTYSGQYDPTYDNGEGYIRRPPQHTGWGDEGSAGGSYFVPSGSLEGSWDN